MNTSGRIARIRKQLLFNQSEMALFMELSPSLLSLIEIQKRSEPKHVKKHADELSLLLVTNQFVTAQKNSIQKNLSKSDLTRMKKEIQLRQLQLKKEEKKRKLMNEEYHKFSIAIFSVQTLIADSKRKKTTPHPLLIQKLNRLSVKILTCDLVKQELVKARIEGIKKEIEIIGCNFSIA